MNHKRKTRYRRNCKLCKIDKVNSRKYGKKSSLSHQEQTAKWIATSLERLRDKITVKFQRMFAKDLAEAILANKSKLEGLKNMFTEQ